LVAARLLAQHRNTITLRREMSFTSLHERHQRLEFTAVSAGSQQTQMSGAFSA
jgi:hypothetical protein